MDFVMFLQFGVLYGFRIRFRSITLYIFVVGLYLIVAMAILAVIFDHLSTLCLFD